MKCRKCNKKAVVNLKDYKIALCESCYPIFYEKLVERSIKRYRIIKEKEKVLAAVSGGKDSVSMISALKEIQKKLNFELEVLHINLGIKGYSEKLEKIVKDVTSILELEFNTVELKDYGFTIDDVEIKKICSACGISKRYLMNKTARELNFDVVVTGHTSEDIIEFFFKNCLSGNFELNKKLIPRIDSFDKKIVAKARPIFDRTEKENMLYVLCKKLPFSMDACPHAPRRDWKEIIYYIELKKPGFKRAFVVNLAKAMKPEFKEPFKYCMRCGEVSTSAICSFCKLTMKYAKKK